MKSIEEKLWDYIDGTCTATEHQVINLLIETDKLYQDKYNELLLLNNEFASFPATPVKTTIKNRYT